MDAKTARELYPLMAEAGDVGEYADEREKRLAGIVWKLRPLVEAAANPPPGFAGNAQDLLNRLHGLPEDALMLNFSSQLYDDIRAYLIAAADPQAEEDRDLLSRLREELATHDPDNCDCGLCTAFYEAQEDIGRAHITEQARLVPKPSFEEQLAEVGARCRYIVGTAEAPRPQTVVVTAENGEIAEYYVRHQLAVALAFARENRKRSEPAALAADGITLPAQGGDVSSSKGLVFGESFMEILMARPRREAEDSFWAAYGRKYPLDKPKQRCYDGLS